MAATQNPQSDDGKEELNDREGSPPVPDEAGPHDVPDDEVIEQTLPGKRPSRESRPS